MTAVDTNILVRFITGDHPAQSAAARTLLATGKVWISKTVLLETHWVLRYSYDYEENAILGALTSLMGLENVRVEDEAAVVAAFSLGAQGIDLADALHLSSRPPGASFVSFDKTFVRSSTRAGALKVSTPQMLR